LLGNFGYCGTSQRPFKHTLRRENIFYKDDVNESDNVYWKGHTKQGAGFSTEVLNRTVSQLNIKKSQVGLDKEENQVINSSTYLNPLFIVSAINWF
jgi:hypothetical protein